VRIGLLKEFAGCLAELGSGEEAAMLFRQALEESTLILGPQTVLLQVELLSSLASVIAISDPEEAHSKIKQCHDLLDELPPGYEPVSRLDLRLLSSSVDNATVSSDGRGGKVEARLRDLEQRFGHAFPEERALLMLQKAEALMASWDRDGAQDLLEMAKRVLEERARSHTVVYAMVLSKFIETLLPDDPRVMEYRKQAAAIMEEAERASSYLDHQDEE
jgi:hypothetical protein